MVGGISQFAELLQNGRLHPFLIFFVLTWGVFGVRILYSMRNREILDKPEYDKNITTSAIVFSFRDKPELLRQSLASIKAQKTPFTEVVVAIDAKETEDRLEIIRESGFRTHVDSSGNKRDAFAGSLPLTTGQIIVHLAGDTIYPPDMNTKAVIAFASDPKIGGVAFRQSIVDYKRTMARRLANVMYSLRFSLTYRALSRRGSLICVTGETGFWRREPIEKHMHEFTNEYFMGKRCLIGDDRFLTSMVLKEGYSVVLQEGAGEVFTDCPDTFTGLVRQQLRWYRSNQRYSIKTLFGWIPGRQFLKMHIGAYLLLPYLWVMVLIWSLANAQFNIYPVEVLEKVPVQVLLPSIAISFVLAMLLKTSPHFFRHPKDLWFFPLYIPFATLIVLPTFMYALVTVGDQGSWETKRIEGSAGLAGIFRSRLGILVLILALLMIIPLIALEIFTGQVIWP